MREQMLPEVAQFSHDNAFAIWALKEIILSSFLAFLYDLVDVLLRHTVNHLVPALPSAEMRYGSQRWDGGGGDELTWMPLRKPLGFGSHQNHGLYCRTSVESTTTTLVR